MVVLLHFRECIHSWKWLIDYMQSALSTNLCIETVDWANVYLERNLPLSLAGMDNPHFSVSEWKIYYWTNKHLTP